MGQTKEGAKKASETMKTRYGDDFFKIRAKKASDASKNRHFKNKEIASKEGRKGAGVRWKN